MLSSLRFANVSREVNNACFEYKQPKKIHTQEIISSLKACNNAKPSRQRRVLTFLNVIQRRQSIGNDFRAKKSIFNQIDKKQTSNKFLMASFAWHVCSVPSQMT